MPIPPGGCQDIEVLGFAVEEVAAAHGLEDRAKPFVVDATSNLAMRGGTRTRLSSAWTLLARCLSNDGVIALDIDEPLASRPTAS